MHAFTLALILTAGADKPAMPATLDEKIVAALKNHPDVKAAEAKKMLAEAELEQAKLAITQKVSAAVAKIELAKAKLIEAEEAAVIYDRILKMGGAASEIEKAQYAKARPVLIGAKAELAAAELELQQLVGKGGTADLKPADKSGVGKTELNLPSGPAMEKLENAVRMTVKLDFKDMERKKAIEGLFSAVKVDSASVRGLKLLYDPQRTPEKADLIGEQTFAGWVQLLLDEHNHLNGSAAIGVYVREYGLLVEYVQLAPKDALTLTELSRMLRANQK